MAVALVVAALFPAACRDGSAALAGTAAATRPFNPIKVMRCFRALKERHQGV